MTESVESTEEETVETKIIYLFESIANAESDISAIRQEIKDSIEKFCEENDEFEAKVVKETYRFFKRLAKDKSSTVDQEFQRDKLVELLIGTRKS